MPAFASAYWKLSVPHDWTARNDPECSTFERVGSSSALQISSARKEGLVTDEDLREFAEDHLSAGAKTAEVRVGEFTGFLFRYRDGIHDTREWFLRCGATAVFVTYNCPIEAAGEEDELVDSILDTLRTQEFAL